MKFIKTFYNEIKTSLNKKRLSLLLEKDIRGEGNKFNYSSTSFLVNSTIEISGNNNEIVIDDLCVFKNVTFFIRGNNNKIKISKGVRFNRGGSLWIEDDNCLIEISDESTFEDVHIAVTEPGSKIIIGKDCMFANDIELRTGDSHSIIDALSNKRINFAKNIIIEDHVWIASHCTILKGVTINRNSVIAARSLVTKSFEKQGVIVGGNPAKILKENITWDRKRIYYE